MCFPFGMDIVQHLLNSCFSYLHEKYIPLQEKCQITFTDYGIMGIFFECRAQRIRVLRLEIDHIAGRRAGNILLNRIVNVVALGIFRKAFDAGFLDFHIGHPPVLPNQALHALFSLRSILVIQRLCIGGQVN